MSDHIREGVVKQVSSVSNPIIKDIRNLSQRKHRKQSNQFLAEGLQLVGFGIENGWTIRTFVYNINEAAHPVIQTMAAKAKARGALVLEVNNAVMSKLVRRDNPQMVVGVFDQRLKTFADVHPKPDETWVALEGIRDPGNLGTVMRSIDAAGAHGLLMVGDTTDPFALETVRASMGSIFHVPVAKGSLDDFRTFRKSWKGTVIGTHLQGSLDYRAIEYSTPTLLLMGNEQSGLPDDIAQDCDLLVKIPMGGKAESLNLAMSTVVMLFEARRVQLTL